MLCGSQMLPETCKRGVPLESGVPALPLFVTICPNALALCRDVSAADLDKSQSFGPTLEECGTKETTVIFYIFLRIFFLYVT